MTDNESAVLKVRIMYKLKMMAFAQKCQHKVDEALRDMNAMEKRKWEVQEETRLERDMLEQQLKVRRGQQANLFHDRCEYAPSGPADFGRLTHVRPSDALHQYCRPFVQATQADLADAQGMLERTGKDLSRTTRNKNKLMKWKLDRKADYQQMKQRCALLEAQKV